MLRDVVVHILNEQPLLADLVVEPKPSDVTLICRNLRTLNGKAPVFVDAADSTFVLPLAGIRFLEIHRESMEAYEAEVAALPQPATPATRTPSSPAAPGAPAIEMDEFASTALARINWAMGASDEEFEMPGLTDPVERSPRLVDADGLDDDLMRRIREA